MTRLIGVLQDRMFSYSYLVCVVRQISLVHRFLKCKWSHPCILAFPILHYCPAGTLSSTNILSCNQYVAAGVTGLKLSNLQDNWGSSYQFTNEAGIPAPTGVYWNFEYVDISTFTCCNLLIFTGCNILCIDSWFLYSVVVYSEQYSRLLDLPQAEARGWGAWESDTLPMNFAGIYLACFSLL